MGISKLEEKLSDKKREKLSLREAAEDVVEVVDKATSEVIARYPAPLLRKVGGGS